MDLCLAPLLLLGYAMTTETQWHHTQKADGTMVEVQTCDRGLGLHAKATTSGVYALGPQYGFQQTWGDYSLTLTPQAGLSYIDHPIHCLPMRGQFELGLQVAAGYQQARISIEYWHLSNAGLQQPNIGLDLIAIQTGWRF